MRSLILSLLLCVASIAFAQEDKTDVTPVKHPDLRAELLQRTKVDQEARQALIQFTNKRGTHGMVVLDGLDEELKSEFQRITTKLQGVDADNTKWLKKTVLERGWPTLAMVGKDGANAAWLLVQHADAEVKFQRTCLDLMAKLPKGEVLPSNLAYLTDRVLLAEGKKQRYGTQFTYVDGRLEARPIDDEANVDSRRAEVGLPPLAEYKKLIESMYGGGQE